MNACGTSLFVFGVLTKLDTIRGLLLMNCVSMVPSVFKIFRCLSLGQNAATNSSSPANTQQRHLVNVLANLKLSRRNRIIITASLNIVSMIMQHSCLLIICLTGFVSSELCWRTSVSLILISASSSRNYLSLHRFANSPLKASKSRLHKLMSLLDSCKHSGDLSRHKIGLLTSLVKIGAHLIFAYIFFPHAFTRRDADTSPTHVFASGWQVGVMLAHSIGSLVCYMCASFAFKLRMHRCSFALPISLVSPLTIAVALIVCECGFVLADISRPFACDSGSAGMNMKSNYRDFLIGVCIWWLSHLWTTNHVWMRYKRRLIMTTIKRPFKAQYFNSIFADAVLMLDAFGSIGSTACETTMFRCQTETPPTATTTTTTPPSAPPQPAKLYLCATIWHENAKEMLQLIKSIMRFSSHTRAKILANSFLFFFVSFFATKNL